MTSEPQPDQPTSSETGRIDPQTFPHPPRQGGGFPATLENVRHLLTETGFVARFNVIKKRLELRRTDRSPATMNQIASAAMLNDMGTGWLFPFVDEIGGRNPHNPVRDWMLGRPWDGTDRLEAFYTTVLEADDYLETLKRSLLYRWLLCAAGGHEGRTHPDPRRADAAGRPRRR